MVIKTPRIAPGNRKCQNLYFYSGVNDVVIKITMDMPNTSLIIEILLFVVSFMFPSPVSSFFKIKYH